MSTVRIPQVVPSPAQDCERLRKAFQGFGTDEKAIIWVLAHRNAKQRNEIRETYHQLYNKSLLDGLHSELSGDFRKAVILWTYEAAERDARLANEALKSKRKNIKNFQVIVEIACATSPRHLVAVRKAYCSLFDTSLEEDIILHVSPPIHKILVSLVRSYRYDKQVVDSTLAHKEAIKLREAIETRKLADNELILILSTRNIFQLRQTFQFYKDTYGKSIHQEIKACENGVLESVVKVVVLCIDSPEIHFAEVVRSAIVGLGTDEDSLSRAIITRAEIDLMNIKEVYLKEYKVSMEDDVIGDTSGDYKEFLMSLLGANM